jgi:hypothetical protein
MEDEWAQLLGQRRLNEPVRSLQDLEQWAAEGAAACAMAYPPDTQRGLVRH